MPAHVRKNDLVFIRTGDARGQTGKVLRVIPDRNLVVIQGINVHKKHVKPNQANPQGGIIEREMPIHISNVSPVADGKPTRVRFEERKDGSKVRVAVVNGQVLGAELRKASKK